MIVLGVARTNSRPPLRIREGGGGGGGGFFWHGAHLEIPDSDCAVAEGEVELVLVQEDECRGRHELCLGYFCPDAIPHILHLHHGVQV